MTAMTSTPHFARKSAQRLGLSFVVTIAVLPGVAQPPPPQPLVASPGDETVFLQWNDFVPAIDHLVEYKESSAIAWLVFAHAPSAAPGISVTNLGNGTEYDFRVSTISADGQSTPTTVVAVMPYAGAIHASNNAIISTGQSLASGYNSFPILSTSQPYSNLMLNATWSGLVPLIEPIVGSGFGETMSSALANMITQLALPVSPNYITVVGLSTQANSPYAYEQLAQGTAPYIVALSQVSLAKQFSLADNKTLVAPVMTVVHGESDEVLQTTAVQYEANLVEWRNDYETDIAAITGQSEPLRLFTDQVSSWARFGFATPRIALAQYAAAKNHPGDIVLVAPKYMLDYVDGYHLKNYSSRRLGEYYAKVYKKVIVDGELWLPLSPSSITLSGNLIHATFHVPVEPLEFDTLAVSYKENYGFEYADSSNSASITDVQIIAPNVVEITLSGVPTGADPRLRYAYTGTIGAWSGAHSTEGSARGNLRDSDTTQAFYQDSHVPKAMGVHLRNWAVTFDEPISLSTVTNASQLVAVQDHLNIYPNPAREEVFLNYFAVNGGAVKLTIQDVTSRQVVNQLRIITNGPTTFYLPLPQVANGMYLLTVVDGAQCYQQRLMIKQ